MSDEASISVNFGKAIPLFPLDTVALMPQQIVPLHIFEPRYQQMVTHALDGSGQIAMAVFRGTRWKQEYHGRPPVMPAVCIGQIIRHERLDDETYNLLIQGVCRARITRELAPEDDRLYRLAMLEPVGVNGDDADGDDRLDDLRARVQASLADGPLRHLRAADGMLKFTQNPQVPTEAVIELLAVSIIDDGRTRYRLLAEGDVRARADIVGEEVIRLERLLSLAERQTPTDWPKGCSWN